MKFKIILLFLPILCLGCEKFLDKKPDKQLVVPQTLEDIHAILNRVDVLNISVLPDALELSADNYYLEESDWQSLSLLEYRNMYLWNQEPLYTLSWIQPYRAIFYANTALDELKKIEALDMVQERYKNRLEGTALFFRGYYFFKLAQVFAGSYSEASAEKPGIVLRLDSDLNKPSRRSTIGETYAQIEADLKESVSLLSQYTSPKYPTEPSIAAAYGALAELYLSMGRFELAGEYADNSLVNWKGNLDFRTLDVQLPNPFERYNPDVIFFTAMVSNQIAQRLKVDEELYNLYDESDIRKEIFFSTSPTGGRIYKGDYNQNISSLFCGITVGEMVLVQVERDVRRNRLDDAKANMQRLLMNRYYDVPDLESFDQEGFLAFIFDERRRELAFKGKRWNDIRRGAGNNGDRKLMRKLGDQTVIFDQNAFDYAHLIPLEVVDRAGIAQNVN